MPDNFGFFILIFVDVCFAAQVVMDKVSNRPKGFAFVTFSTVDEARTALVEMDGKVQLQLCSLFFSSSFLLSFLRISLQGL